MLTVRTAGAEQHGARERLTIERCQVVSFVVLNKPDKLRNDHIFPVVDQHPNARVLQLRFCPWVQMSIRALFLLCHPLCDFAHVVRHRVLSDEARG